MQTFGRILGKGVEGCLLSPDLKSLDGKRIQEASVTMSSAVITLSGMLNLSTNFRVFIDSSSWNHCMCILLGYLTQCQASATQEHEQKAMLSSSVSYRYSQLSPSPAPKQKGSLAIRASGGYGFCLEAQQIELQIERDTKG